jgi:RNA polymerase sigma-70 factor (ECF subfamily)
MTDEMIVELYWQHDERAIKETELAYGGYIRYVAYAILRDESDAEEITNDTYLKAWNSIPPQRPRPLKAFLGRIARQLSLNRDEYNTADKRGGSQYPLALDELLECVADKDTAPDAAELIALTDALNAFLRSLPTDARRMFIRRYWYMDSIADIASAFAASESRVKSTLARASEKLRKTLEKEGFDV